MGVVRRRSEDASSPNDLGEPGLDALATAYPLLFEFLTTSAYEDGKSRIYPTLLVMYEAGVFKACLNDRDQGLSCWVSSRSLAGSLEALEKGLAGDCLEWRKPASPGRKRR